MGRKTYEYNEQTGTYYETEDNADGSIIIRTMQDVEPVLDAIEKRRNSGYQDRGIKKNWWRYATIPAAVWLRWKDEGIDIFNKDQTKEILKKINQEYPKLKNTYLSHQ